jgi:catechol 2,3-dioxygenase-like lactoylglutathione lyase family enzyme
MITGLSHITFICKDLAKTTHMLKELFSAEEIYSSHEKNFSISTEKFFNVAGIWIAIMEGSSVSKTYNHIAFKVDEKELVVLEQKIKKLGLVILPGRDRDKSEGQSLYFYDYDNHLFEFHTGDLKSRLEFYNA